MEVMYNHSIFFSTLYTSICLVIIQWYVVYPMEETKRRIEQMKKHCKKLYDTYL